MKHLLLIPVFTLFIFLDAKSQINMDCGGNVSVGNTTPDAYTLSVKGTTKFTTGTSGGVIFDNSGYSNSPAVYGGANLGKVTNNWYAVYATHVYETSDLRQKENIRKLSSSLGLILQLNGVKFDYLKESAAINSLISDGTNEEKIDAARKNHVGFIAQDVEKVIPEVVFYDDSTDIYSIDLTKLTPYLVEAIKEQQEIIKNLEAEIEDIKRQISIDNTLKSLPIIIDNTDLDTESDNILFQNRPNPFSKSTTINYFLEKENQNAMINIYDLNGLQLKSIKLIHKGKGNIIINAGEFKAGMYIYALIIDNELIDSKRMILSN